jgi:predicted ABC-type ATPase
MIAGPNGSGKSTLIALLMAAGIDFGEYLNADDIAHGMHGDPVHVAAAAQAEVRHRREQALLQRRNYSFETGAIPSFAS